MGSLPAWVATFAGRVVTKLTLACALTALAGSASAWAESAPVAASAVKASGAHVASDDCLCTIPSSLKVAASAVPAHPAAPAKSASDSAIASVNHGFIDSVKSLFSRSAPSTAGSVSTVMAPDPFATDTWHAVTPSWPGTIKFDGLKHTVVLSPMGAPAIHATYSYTLKPQAKTSKPGDVASLDGVLTMVSQGQTVNAAFHLANGKDLTLTFAGGMKRPENYLRMSPAEESAEIARIKQLMADGKLKLSPAQLAALNSAQ